MLERTLVLLKPDAVARGIMGRIISRFEDAGFKIIGAKMVWVDTSFARKHYDEIGEVGKRRGEKVLQHMLNLLSDGPVLALCIEGVDAVENVRKMAGTTEPKAAPPGTIRGDFAHVSFAHAGEKKIGIKNVIHASANKSDAEREIKLWFKEKELHSYKTVHEIHVFE